MKPGILSNGTICAAVMLAGAALLPGMASAASSTPAPATQAQPATPPMQQKAMAPSKTTSSGTTMATSERSEVKAAQEALNKHGSSLNIDGKLGAKTREALKSFQAKNGLTPTGRLDKRTETALNVSKM